MRKGSRDCGAASRSVHHLLLCRKSETQQRGTIWLVSVPNLPPWEFGNQNGIFSGVDTYLPPGGCWTSQLFAVGTCEGVGAMGNTSDRGQKNSLLGTSWTEGLSSLFLTSLEPASPMTALVI